MSQSQLVDERYRLTAADLAGRPRHLRVVNVTTQGLEDLVPVLHFEGVTKRLVLTPALTEQVIALTGSTLFADWIGHTMVLQPRRIGGDLQITVVPTHASARTHAMPPQRTDDQQGWRLAWLVVGLLALVSAAYVLLNAAQFDAYLGPLLR